MQCFAKFPALRTSLFRLWKIFVTHLRLGHLSRWFSLILVSCSSMGANVCCGKDSVCALDQAGNVACCPNRAACTGSVAAGSTPTAATSAASQAGPTPGAAISHAISGTSTISNQYYPFPVLPTPFANAAVCTTAYSVCQAESAKCTGYVEGGGGSKKRAERRPGESVTRGQAQACR